MYRNCYKAPLIKLQKSPKIHMPTFIKWLISIMSYMRRLISPLNIKLIYCKSLTLKTIIIIKIVVF